MSTATTLKLALELAAKVTGREELAALAGEVQELGPLSDETAAETAQLAESLESLSRQQVLIQQFNDSKAALTQLDFHFPRKSFSFSAAGYISAAGYSHKRHTSEHLIAAR